MDAFAWSVVGSVAGVIGAVAVIVFGLAPMLRRHKEALPHAPSEIDDRASSVRACDVGIRGAVDADEVAGYVAGVCFDRPESDNVDGTARVRKVKKGGKAIGVHLGRFDDLT